LKELEITAKTVEEATRMALEQLGVSKDEVEIIVIKKGKSGVLNVGAEDARIRVIIPESSEKQALINDQTERISKEEYQDVAIIAKQVLADLLSKMEISATVEIARSSDNTAPISLNIEGDDLGVLIGRRGQALSSLQYLVRLIVAEKIKKWVSISVDVDWYKKRHYEALKKLALRLAEQVIRRKRPITMEPMPPDERRIIHITLANNPEVITQSTGEGESRRVIIQSRKR
jgi:spoIIIJ-associated protein